MWRRTADRAQRLVRSIAAGALLAAGAFAQLDPVTLDVAVAASPHRTNLPALVWLCEHGLPALVAWPAEVDPRGPFRLTLANGAVAIAPTAAALAADVAYAGACRVDGGAPALFACSTDGVEDWFVPSAFTPPAPWLTLLDELRALR